MSIFGGVDIAGAEDISFDIPPGTYRGTVTDVTLKPGNKNPDDVFLVFEYTLEDFPAVPLREWQRIPEGDPDSWDAVTPVTQKGHTQAQLNEWARSGLKRRLGSLGVPQERMNSLTESDLDNFLGLSVVVTTKKDPKTDYAQIRKVELARDGGPSLPTPTPPAAAKEVSNPWGRTYNGDEDK